MKLYTEIDTRVKDPSQIKEEYSNTIATEFAPNMAERARVALSVDVYKFWVFHKIKTGRRCSCWDIESTPDGLCEVCYGSGVVGGFEKRGCKTEVIDATYPNIVTVNVLPDFDEQTRPLRFTLQKTATRGYFDVEIPILQNLGVLDYMDLISHQPPGTTVSAYIKTYAEASFVPMSRVNVQSRLASTRLVLRVIMSRVSPENDRPSVTSFMLRYRMMPDIRINVDIPKRTESMILAELGISDNFASITMVFDSTLSNLSNEDFLVLLDPTGRPITRFRVVEITRFSPFNTTIGWEAQAQYVHDYEVYRKFPIESFDLIVEADLDPNLTQPRGLEPGIPPGTTR